ncbi:hypothetical protein ACJMK2_037613 [Sinanodonta woodiana]|uniref:Uncharacterized protein n=1 Tax=Sinanodonta woodiana TaxID=1069815 RepID=A0ABD3WPI0_SINWO
MNDDPLVRNDTILLEGNIVRDASNIIDNHMSDADAATILADKEYFIGVQFISHCWEVDEWLVTNMFDPVRETFRVTRSRLFPRPYYSGSSDIQPLRNAVTRHNQLANSLPRTKISTMSPVEY